MMQEIGLGERNLSNQWKVEKVRIGMERMCCLFV